MMNVKVIVLAEAGRAHLGDSWVCLWPEGKAGASLCVTESLLQHSEDTGGGPCLWWRKMSSSGGSVEFGGPG